MKRFWLGLIVLLLLIALSSCSGTRIMMQQAPKAPKAHPTLPALQVDQNMKTGLETHIFGRFPKLSDVEIESVKLIAENAFVSGDTVKEWRVQAGYGGQTKPFHIVLVTQTDKPKAPYIITQNFCPNNAVVPIDGITPPTGDYFDCSGGGLIGNVFGYFFGRYITVPPYEMILDRGYNLAVIYPPEFVPDSASRAPAAINSLFGHKSETAPSALMIWASLSDWLAGELKQQNQTDEIIAYGHSRYGKTALLALAYGENIDGAIAHQSGTGGASILRDNKGESIKAIMENYPHWFTYKFNTYRDSPASLPVDAHMLLALAAPKPIMLGNARRDVWSDPEGAFYAAQAATQAWEKFGKTGLTAKRLDEFNPEDDIAFWMRPGTHGVVEEDWPAFLDFLAAHFGQ